MSKRIQQIARVGIVALSALGIAGSSMASPTVSRFPVVDLHVDLSYQVNYRKGSIANASGQLLAGELIASGVVGLVLPLYIPQEVSAEGPRMLDIESSYCRMFELLAATPPYSVPGAPRENSRVQTWFSLEGAAPFAGRSSDVKKWVNHGVIIWGLVHGHDNVLASSSGMGVRRQNVEYGLTAQGVELVQAIHAAGGVVDISHASDPAAADILALARKDHVPVIATHSNARALVAHARNLTDDQIKAVAEVDGIVGIAFHDKYLAAGRAATIQDVVRHMQHIRNLVGTRHIAIGSDFEGGIHPPRGIKDVRDFPKVATAMLDAGFTTEEVRAILSGNVLRLMARLHHSQGNLAQ